MTYIYNMTSPPPSYESGVTSLQSTIQVTKKKKRATSYKSYRGWYVREPRLHDDDDKRGLDRRPQPAALLLLVLELAECRGHLVHRELPVSVLVGALKGVLPHATRGRPDQRCWGEQAGALFCVSTAANVKPVSYDSWRKVLSAHFDDACTLGRTRCAKAERRG